MEGLQPKDQTNATSDDIGKGMFADGRRTDNRLVRSSEPRADRREDLSQVDRVVIECLRI